MNLPGFTAEACRETNFAPYQLVASRDDESITNAVVPQFNVRCAMATLIAIDAPYIGLGMVAFYCAHGIA